MGIFTFAYPYLSTIFGLRQRRFPPAPKAKWPPTRMWQYEMDEEAHPNQGEAEREAEKTHENVCAIGNKIARRKACFFRRE